MFSSVLAMTLLAALTVCGKGSSSEASNEKMKLGAALDKAISTAILEHNEGKYYSGEFSCESHVALATEEGNSTNSDSMDVMTVYAVSLYQEYQKSEDTVEAVSGGCTPIALTFKITKDGEYALQEYWEPTDGSEYAEDIRIKFPKEVADSVLNGHNYSDDLQTQNYHKALEYVK